MSLPNITDLRANRHLKSMGGQTSLSTDEETCIVQNIATLADWGYPMNGQEVALLVRDYLQDRSRTITTFCDNTLAADWIKSFLKRQRNIISVRLCRNITRKRGNLPHEMIFTYFENLMTSLEGIPPSNILNQDETNLTDDPGQKKCIFRRGCKYHDRIMNSTKASTSIMTSCSASGVLLHHYIVYKSEHLHDRWIQGGPLYARYNRSRSGWFDNRCFTDWFKLIILPYCKHRPGKK